MGRPSIFHTLSVMTFNLNCVWIWLIFPLPEFSKSYVVLGHSCFMWYIYHQHQRRILKTDSYIYTHKYILSSRRALVAVKKCFIFHSLHGYRGKRSVLSPRSCSLCHALFPIFAFSAVDSICFLAIPSHVKGVLVPFISAVNLFPPFENWSLVLKNSCRYSAGAAFPRRVSPNFFIVVMTEGNSLHVFIRTLNHACDNSILQVLIRQWRLLRPTFVTFLWKKTGDCDFSGGWMNWMPVSAIARSFVTLLCLKGQRKKFHNDVE